MRTTLGVATLLLAVAEAWVYRMVALDMDGTALDSHHQLSDATVTFLRALYATGTIVSFCTGRSTPAAAPHIQRLGLDYMPVVAYNGAVSLIFEKNEAGEVVPTHELFKKPVPSDAAEQILRVAADNGLLAQYYVGHQIYVAPKTQQHRAFVEKYAAMSGGVEHVVVNDYTEPIGMGEPYKLLVFSDDVEGTYQLFKKELPEGLIKLGIGISSHPGEAIDMGSIRGTPPFFVELLHPEVNKGLGLKEMAASISLDLKSVVAFGDGDNDVEFLEANSKNLSKYSLSHVSP